MMQIEFKECDFSDYDQACDYVDMVNEYMVHPMGGEILGHDKALQLKLADGLMHHPSAKCFFMIVDGARAGIATCFVNFSTFKVKPYLYIHDFFVRSSFRGKNLSKPFLSYLVDYSKEHGYCKVTLEVRCDNEVAKGLYCSLGFRDCEPVMYFWSKFLD